MLKPTSRPLHGLYGNEISVQIAAAGAFVSRASGLCAGGGGRREILRCPFFQVQSPPFRWISRCAGISLLWLAAHAAADSESCQ